MNPETYSIIIVWSDEDQVFVATVPELSGCMAHGETRAEAIKEAEIAIKNWIDTARELGREIPPPKHSADYEKQLEQSVSETSEERQAEMRKAITEAMPAMTPGIVEALATYFAQHGEDVWATYSEQLGIRVWRHSHAAASEDWAPPTRKEELSDAEERASK
jgi:predicted RNase H-like HicB family nuclease